MVALAKEDVAVRNSATIEIIDKIGNPANRVIEIEGADHTTISIDFELSSKVIQNGIDFLDAIVASRQGGVKKNSLIEWTISIVGLTYISLIISIIQHVQETITHH